MKPNSHLWVRTVKKYLWHVNYLCKVQFTHFFIGPLPLPKTFLLFDSFDMESLANKFGSNIFIMSHSHTALFLRIVQIALLQLSDSENKKCSPWKVFGINYPQTLRLLSRRGPRSPDARLSQHYIGPKMTFYHFFNFCRKFFPAWQ